MTALARRRPEGDAGGESGDKTFWISFADLMTALMVLFMMVMAVALLAITRSQTTVSAIPSAASSPTGPAAKARLQAGAPAASAASQARDDRELMQFAAMAAASSPSDPSTPPTPPTPQEKAVEKLMQQLAQAVDASPGVQLDARRHVIDFGDRARFATGSYRLDEKGAQALRSFVPKLLEITTSELGRRWVSRVVVEGFADPRGTYLFNLDLSLNRAESVLCTLLAPVGDGTALQDAQREEVRRIFAVGGFSFNDGRESLDASRRIEMRIEFGPAPPAPAAPSSGIGTCRLAA